MQYNTNTILIDMPNKNKLNAQGIAGFLIPNEEK